jgi:hypothetical protein
MTGRVIRGPRGPSRRRSRLDRLGGEDRGRVQQHDQQVLDTGDRLDYVGLAAQGRANQ